MMPPVGQHLPGCLPVGRRGEAARAGQEPHLKQHADQLLSQLLRNAACNQQHCASQTGLQGSAFAVIQTGETSGFS